MPFIVGVFRSDLRRQLERQAPVPQRLLKGDCLRLRVVSVTAAEPLSADGQPPADPERPTTATVLLRAAPEDAPLVGSASAQLAWIREAHKEDKWAICPNTPEGRAHASLFVERASELPSDQPAWQKFAWTPPLAGKAMGRQPLARQMKVACVVVSDSGVGADDIIGCVPDSMKPPLSLSATALVLLRPLAKKVCDKLIMKRVALSRTRGDCLFVELKVPLRWGDKLIPNSALSDKDLRVPGSELLLWPWSDGGFSAFPLRALGRGNLRADWRERLERGDRVALLGSALESPRRRPGFYVGLVEAAGSLLSPAGVVVSVSLGGPAERISVRDQHVACKLSLFRALLESPDANSELLGIPSQLLENPPPPPPPQAAGGPARLCSTAARWGVRQPPVGAPLSFISVEKAVARYALQFRPTASQRRQYELMLRHRLSSLWGPPGSGKTFWAVRCERQGDIASLRPAALSLAFSVSVSSAPFVRVVLTVGACCLLRVAGVICGGSRARVRPICSGERHLRVPGAAEEGTTAADYSFSCLFRPCFIPHVALRRGNAGCLRASPLSAHR